MPGRILNFSEFFDKYSKDSGNTGKSLDDFTNSAANFEEGLDFINRENGLFLPAQNQNIEL